MTLPFLSPLVRALTQQQTWQFLPDFLYEVLPAIPACLKQKLQFLEILHLQQVKILVDLGELA